MVRKLSNTELNIDEDDIKACTNLDTLYHWKQELRKQIAAMNGKIRTVETSNIPSSDDNYISRLYGYKTVLTLTSKLVTDSIAKVKTSNLHAFNTLLLENIKEVTPTESYEAILTETRLEFDATNILANELLLQANCKETINEEEFRSFSR